MDIFRFSHRYRSYRYLINEVCQCEWRYVRHVRYVCDDRIVLHFISSCCKKVALGVAYALWEGIGILIITSFSVMWFGESLSPMKIGGLTLLIAGIGLIKSGTKKATVKQSTATVKRMASKAANTATTVSHRTKEA